jgi:hypothetical protein
VQGICFSVVAVSLPRHCEVRSNPGRGGQLTTVRATRPAPGLLRHARKETIAVQGVCSSIVAVSLPRHCEVRSNPGIGGQPTTVRATQPAPGLLRHACKGTIAVRGVCSSVVAVSLPRHCKVRSNPGTGDNLDCFVHRNDGRNTMHKNILREVQAPCRQVRNVDRKCRRPVQARAVRYGMW